MPTSPGHILYLTTGMLIRQMHSDRELSGYSHIILDEVHERNLETDVSMILLRELLQRYDPPCFWTTGNPFISRPTLKLILASATLQADRIHQYFSASAFEIYLWSIMYIFFLIMTINITAKILTVPGKSYSVKPYFLEDLQDMWASELPPPPQFNQAVSIFVLILP